MTAKQLHKRFHSKYDKARYTAINLHSVQKHGTVELRYLPVGLSKDELTAHMDLFGHLMNLEKDTKLTEIINTVPRHVVKTLGL